MQDKIEISLTRRQLLQILIVGGVVVGGYGWKLLRMPNRTFTIKLPDIIDDKASFDIFFALSKIITARAALDEKATQKIYAVISAEPWSEAHIVSCYKKILFLLEGAALIYPPYTPTLHQQLNTDEKWFISHLLTTWYVGIYYYEAKAPMRVLYQQALMFEKLKQTYPIPFITAVGYGKWAEPPIDAS